MIRRLSWIFAVVSLLVAAGCGRDRGLTCIEDERYASAVEAPPLSIPDDLTVPDETDALRIPDRSVGGAARDGSLPCLESPPDFFEGQTGG